MRSLDALKRKYLGTLKFSTKRLRVWENLADAVNAVERVKALMKRRQ